MNRYVNPERMRKCKEEGDRIEKLFIATLKKKFKDTKGEKSDKNEDIFDHIDGKIRIKIDGKWEIFSYDIKANINGKFWFEWRNVNNKIGWGEGKADCIIFHNGKEKYFRICSRKELLAFVNKKVCKKLNISKKEIDLNNCIETRNYEVYGLYTRKGRSDVFTRILEEDLDILKTYIVRY